MKVLLDLDGVMADLVGGLMAVHRKPWPFGAENCGPDAWYLEKAWGITVDELWEPCGFDFWANLPMTLEATELYRLLCHEFGRENLCFCSHPISKPGCVQGKTAWCHRNFPYTPILFTVPGREGNNGGVGQKEFLASPDVLLIDDNQGNCQRFEEAGGLSFLWPAWWNDRHEQTHFRLHLLEEFIRHVAHFDAPLIDAGEYD